MSVVLLVLAVVTHLAFRQLGTVRDQKLAQAADRQLETVRDAVFGYGRDGEPAGFLADMGRLVSATNGTLSELWRRPTGARSYGVRPAIAENLVPAMPDRRALVDTNVCVATGWRGPYLRLPFGRQRLRDPWGNALENPDDAGFLRIGVTNGVAATLTHFGPTALERGRRTLSLVPDAGAACSLKVRVVSKSDAISSDSVTYRWYGPCDGLITGAVAEVSRTAWCAMDGLTPGRRVVTASWGAGGGLSRLVTVRPGDNQFEFEVP